MVNLLDYDKDVYLDEWTRVSDADTNPLLDDVNRRRREAGLDADGDDALSDMVLTLSHDEPIKLTDAQALQLSDDAFDAYVQNRLRYDPDSVLTVDALRRARKGV